MIENISNSHPVARKDHICDLCGCVIPKGEKYRLQTNVYDGRIYNFACHSDCDEVASRLNFYGECDYDEGLTSEYFLEASTSTSMTIITTTKKMIRQRAGRGCPISLQCVKSLMN